MQGPDDGAGAGGAEGSAEGGTEDQGGRRSPDGQGAPDGQDVEGAAGDAGAAGGIGAAVATNPEGILHLPRPAHAPVQGGELVPIARRPGIQPHDFTLRVPFLNPIQAEVARRSLALYGEPHPQAVHRELTVNGSFLVVWTAEDAHLLHMSFIAFLDDLSLVVRTMQRFGPLFPPKSLLGKGG